MASNIVFNGVTYSIPSVGDDGWGSDLSAYFIAIASAALQKTGGSFALTSEVDFGATYGIRSAYLKSQSANPASSGIIRLGNTESIKWRNAANSADLDLTVNASNALQFNGTNILYSGAGLISNADVSPSAAIDYSKLNLTSGIVNSDIANAAAIAYSKLNLSTSIVNADISGSAGIAYSKLNLATSIVNADISGSAAIAYSKLNLATSIVNADISASAAIALSKLAATTASRALVSDGSGLISASSVTSTELGYVSGVTSAIQTQFTGKLDKSTLTTKGDIYVATASATVARQGIGSDGQVLTADSTQTNGLKWANATGGSEGVNFITNGSAETSNIFSQYNDSSTTRPVDGTGGTATNLSSSVSSTSPLAGTQSFLLTKSGSASTQGMGWSVATATIDPAYRAKVLQIEFDYIVNSGTFVAGSSSAESDVIVYLYDVTNSTLIEPSSIKLLSNSTTISDKFVANFQTSATGSQYRLILHCQSTSTANYSLKLDNVKISPCNYVYGTPITDWVSWTPTGSFTNTTYTGKWRRVGDSIEAFVHAVVNNVSGPSPATLSVNYLPSGLAADSTKLNQSNGVIYGYASILDSGSRTYTGSVVYNSASSVRVVHTETGSNGDVSDSAPFTFTINDSISLHLTVPIQGWASSVQQSDGYDGRVIAFSATKTTGQTLTTSVSTLTSWDTPQTDTTASFNATTGIWTAPRSGWYRISGSVASQNTGTFSVYARIQVDGTTRSAGWASPNAVDSCSTIIPAFTLFIDAGKQVKLDASVNTGTQSTRLDNTGTRFDIVAVNAPTTISATSKVSAIYGLTASQAVATNAVLKYDTLIEDSFGAYSTSTGLFTSPFQGTAMVCLSAYMGGTAANLYVKISGVNKGVLFTTSSDTRSGCSSYPVNSGDTIGIYNNNGGTFSATDGTLGFLNKISISFIK